MKRVLTTQSLRDGRGISRLGWVIPAIVAAISLIGDASAAGPQSINLGTPDDPYMVDSRTAEDLTASVVSFQSKAAVNPVNSLSVGQLDASQFPWVCVYTEVLGPDGIPIPHLPADSFCLYQDSIRISPFTIQELTGDSCRTSTCLVIDVSGSMSIDGKLTAA